MGGTAPRSLCLGGELLIPPGRSISFTDRESEAHAAQTHSTSLTSRQGHDRSARNSFPPLAATDYWWSGLHWTAKVDHSQSATNNRVIDIARRAVRFPSITPVEAL